MIMQSYRFPSCQSIVGTYSNRLGRVLVKCKCGTTINMAKFQNAWNLMSRWEKMKAVAMDSLIFLLIYGFIFLIADALVSSKLKKVFPGSFDQIELIAFFLTVPPLIAISIWSATKKSNSRMQDVAYQASARNCDRS